MLTFAFLAHYIHGIMLAFYKVSLVFFGAFVNGLFAFFKAYKVGLKSREGYGKVEHMRVGNL